MMKLKPLLVCALALPAIALAAPTFIRKPLTRFSSKSELQKFVRAGGFKTHGGIDKSKTKDDDDPSRSFPHFTQSFSFAGTEYPYTMVGYPPRSGRSTSVRAVIIPLRMRFQFFAQDATFEPDIAVKNIVASPIFNDAAFPNGVGQFGDQLQRATFWNKMDPQHRWHVRMSGPRVAKTVDVLVEPDIGELIDTGDPDFPFLGNIRFGAMDSIIHTILQYVDVDPDEVPIFVTYNVFADALGYHDAFTVTGKHGNEALQTLIYTSWLEEQLVGSLLADISTVDHEVGEWLNDPYVNNVVPTWKYPPPGDPNAICSFNPFLEVGDPQGNGPTYFEFPTVVIPLNGFSYHLQDLVMLPWFTGEKPSSAFGGWYDFPGTNQIHDPFVPCF
ncbi:MAG TPA: hypothetical protein VLQ79_03010 [Myxococcaceae bacterium]|nr:hypothetical protein [Myxococcaceae bacterium]